eukprot:TRINITY_DN12604_c0_g1_i2.p3 TRINITY_DN12604_c0_g1~~TRINITY_DN12604_c0_g1_i2.p3  ORF type:complete len:116 (-),score=19.67 TRINITY_DN12604_c0_g1_i2:174-521(-)
MTASWRDLQRPRTFCLTTSEFALPASRELVDSIPVLTATPHLLISWRFKDCSACQLNFKLNDKVCQLQCEHLYHEECIKEWLLQHNCCFRCYFDVPGDLLSYENRKKDFEGGMCL